MCICAYVHTVPFANGSSVCLPFRVIMPKKEQCDRDDPDMWPMGVMTCPVCGQAYSNKNSFLRHIRETHGSDRPSLRCHLCDFFTVRQHNMKRHYHRHHSSYLYEPTVSENSGSSQGSGYDDRRETSESHRTPTVPAATVRHAVPKPLASVVVKASATTSTATKTSAKSSRHHGSPRTPANHPSRKHGSSETSGTKSSKHHGSSNSKDTRTSKSPRSPKAKAVKAVSHRSPKATATQTRDPRPSSKALTPGKENSVTIVRTSVPFVLLERLRDPPSTSKDEDVITPRTCNFREPLLPISNPSFATPDATPTYESSLEEGAFSPTPQVSSPWNQSPEIRLEDGGLQESENESPAMEDPEYQESLRGYTAVSPLQSANNRMLFPASPKRRVRFMDAISMETEETDMNKLASPNQKHVLVTPER
jgi:hypothetical protein